MYKMSHCHHHYHHFQQKQELVPQSLLNLHPTLIDLVQHYGMFGHCIWCIRWSNVLPSFCSRMLTLSHQLCSRKRSYLEVCQEQLGALSQLARAYCSLASNPILLVAMQAISSPFLNSKVRSVGVLLSCSTCWRQSC